MSERVELVAGGLVLVDGQPLGRWRVWWLQAPDRGRRRRWISARVQLDGDRVVECHSTRRLDVAGLLGQHLPATAGGRPACPDPAPERPGGQQSSRFPTPLEVARRMFGLRLAALAAPS